MEARSDEGGCYVNKNKGGSSALRAATKEEEQDCDGTELQRLGGEAVREGEKTASNCMTLVSLPLHSTLLHITSKQASSCCRKIGANINQRQRVGRRSMEDPNASVSGIVRALNHSPMNVDVMNVMLNPLSLESERGR